MRARAWACRDAFADALRGLGVREEMEHVQPKQVAARVVSTELRIGDETVVPARIEPEPEPEPEAPKLDEIDPEKCPGSNLGGGGKGGAGE